MRKKKKYSKDGNLTDLQLKIIELTNKNKTSREIAELLNFSEIYIKKNLHTIYRYFGVVNKLELIRELNKLEH